MIVLASFFIGPRSHTSTQAFCAGFAFFGTQKTELGGALSGVRPGAGAVRARDEANAGSIEAGRTTSMCPYNGVKNGGLGSELQRRLYQNPDQRHLQRAQYLQGDALPLPQNTRAYLADFVGRLAAFDGVLGATHGTHGMRGIDRDDLADCFRAIGWEPAMVRTHGGVYHEMSRSFCYQRATTL